MQHQGQGLEKRILAQFSSSPVEDARPDNPIPATEICPREFVFSWCDRIKPFCSPVSIGNHWANNKKMLISHFEQSKFGVIYFLPPQISSSINSIWSRSLLNAQIFGSKKLRSSELIFFLIWTCHHSDFSWRVKRTRFETEIHSLAFLEMLADSNGKEEFVASKVFYQFQICNLQFYKMAWFLK